MGSHVRSRLLPPLAGLTAGLLVLAISLRLLTTPDPYGDPPLAKVDCRTGTTAITVASSPEKFEELGEIARQFNTFRCGGAAAVNVSRISSGDALRQLRDGTWSDGAFPQVWAPAATSWVHRLQHSDPEAVVEGDLPSVTRTPLVLAMPQPIADQIGDQHAVSWERIVNWARDPGLWQRDSEGRWGPFKLGKTDPNYSTSGLHSLLATFTAAAGHAAQPSDFTGTPSALRIQEGVRAVERATLHYGDTTLYYLCALAQADQAAEDRSAEALRKVTDYVTAVPVEEKSVYEYNTGRLKDCPKVSGYRPKVKLTAVYPSDGTIWSDSPYAVLSKTSDGQRRLAGNFLRYLHGKDALDDKAYESPQEVLMSAGFRAVLTPDLGVPDPGGAGLRTSANLAWMVRPDPAVLDGILGWWSRNRKPANVIFLVDVSGSMCWAPESTKPVQRPNRRIDQVVRALEPAVRGLDPMIRAGLWTFSGEKDDPGVERVDKVAAVGSRTETLLGAIGRLDARPSADTALYDAIAQARDELGPVSTDSIAAVVVLTDGENDICTSGDARCRAAQETRLKLLTSGPRDRVRVFTIGYGAQAPGKVLDQIAASNDTKQASTNTKAAGASAEPVDLKEILTDVTRNF